MNTFPTRFARSLALCAACMFTALTLSACGEPATRTAASSSPSQGSSSPNSPASSSPTAPTATSPASSTNPNAAPAAGGSPESSMSSSAPNATTKPAREIAIVGGGCFWGVEHIFNEEIPGVIEAISGYSGGTVPNPTYEQVCTGRTGHAEVVQVTFDPSKVTYEQVIDAFFRMHDATQVNRQGPDIGTQYRSVIYTLSDEQQKVAEAVKARRQAKSSKPFSTTIEPAKAFYAAEDYHQRYYQRTGKEPYCHFLRED